MITKYKDYKKGDVVCLSISHPNEVFIYIGKYGSSYCFIPIDKNTLYASLNDNECIKIDAPKGTIPFKCKPYAFK